ITLALLETRRSARSLASPLLVVEVDVGGLRRRRAVVPLLVDGGLTQRCWTVGVRRADDERAPAGAERRVHRNASIGLAVLHAPLPVAQASQLQEAVVLLLDQQATVPVGDHADAREPPAREHVLVSVEAAVPSDERDGRVSELDDLVSLAPLVVDDTGDDR